MKLRSNSFPNCCAGIRKNPAGSVWACTAAAAVEA